MSARAVATGTISFGLVSIPIKVYISASSGNTSLRMINPKTNNIVKQKLVDAATGDEVERSECHRGYKVGKDQYVTFTNEELAQLRPPKSDHVELTEFVPQTQLNVLAIEKSYYLAPDRGADKAYLVLLKALQNLKTVAVGKWQARSRDNMVMLQPHDGAIIMHQMYYASELRTFDNPCANMDVGEAELELASKLISNMVSDNFDHAKYFDGYEQQLRHAVEEKQAGQPITAASAPQTTVLNLLDALKASVQKHGIADKTADEPAKKVAKKPAKKRSKKKAS